MLKMSGFLELSMGRSGETDGKMSGWFGKNQEMDLRKLDERDNPNLKWMITRASPLGSKRPPYHGNECGDCQIEWNI